MSYSSSPTLQPYFSGVVPELTPQTSTAQEGVYIATIIGSVAAALFVIITFACILMSKSEGLRQLLTRSSPFEGGDAKGVPPKDTVAEFEEENEEV